MKPPKCRLCGKEHYGLCKNVGEAVALAQSPKLRPGGSTPPTFAKEVGSGHTASVPKEGGTGRKSPDDIGRASEEKACKTAALATANEGGADGSADIKKAADPHPCERGAVQNRVSGETPPLTPAQKQKVYRERDPERKRKMDRDLKRRKRQK